MAAAAYEPTNLAKVASLLEPGDEIEIGCGVRKGTIKHPKVLNLEYLSVLSLVEAFDIVNPLCTNCGKRMKSEGTGKGFKCKRCKIRNSRGAKMQILKRRELALGLYLPAVKAYRHLSKPLQRYGREKKNYSVQSTRLSYDGIFHYCTDGCRHMSTSIATAYTPSLPKLGD
jgi:tRNA(Ile2)-agmatinylcytidine synthase